MVNRTRNGMPPLGLISFWPKRVTPLRAGYRERCLASHKAPPMTTRLTASLLLTVFLSLAYGTTAARDAEVEQALLAMSKNINKNLPLQIDKEKALEATAALQDTLVFKYKFTDETTIRNPRFSRTQYEKHLRASLQASTCSDPDLMELMRRGAKFNYLFVDRKGMKIVDFTLNTAHCTP